MKLPLIVHVLVMDSDAKETVPAEKVTAAFVGELLSRTLYVELSEKTGVSLTPGTTPPNQFPPTLNVPPAALPQVMFAWPSSVSAHRPIEEVNAASKAARVRRDMFCSLPQREINLLIPTT